MNEEQINNLANHLCDVGEECGFNCGHGYEIAERIVADPHAHVTALVDAGVLEVDTSPEGWSDYRVIEGPRLRRD